MTATTYADPRPMSVRNSQPRREVERSHRPGITRPLIGLGLLVALIGCANSGPTVEPRTAQAIVTSLGLTPETRPGDVAVALQQSFLDIWRIGNDRSISADDKRAQVRREVSTWLDREALARAALGERASAYPPDAVRDFAKTYVHYVTALFVARFARNRERPVELNQVHLDPERARIAISARGATVGGMFRSFGVDRSGPSEPVRLDLLLRTQGGPWRITAIRFDSVDVSQTFRAQFESVLDREGPEALVSQLRTHNQEAEGQNPFDE